MVEIRDALLEDVPELVELWNRYLLEHYQLSPNATFEAIRRDAFGDKRRFCLALAVAPGGTLCGAIAWGLGYDLHHFVTGVDVHDLYVPSEYRGRGVAVQLLAHVAARGQADGACYLRGSAALDPTPGRRLYDRVCVFFPGATANLSGRAFRHLVALAGASPRDIARSLPQAAWNYEP